MREMRRAGTDGQRDERRCVPTSCCAAPRPSPFASPNNHTPSRTAAGIRTACLRPTGTDPHRPKTTAAGPPAEQPSPRGSPMYAQPPYPKTRDTRENRKSGDVREVRETAAVFTHGTTVPPASSSSPPSHAPFPSSFPSSSKPPAPPPSPAPGRVWWYVLYDELRRRDAAIDALAGRVERLEHESCRNRVPPWERRRYFE